MKCIYMFMFSLKNLARKAVGRYTHPSSNISSGLSKSPLKLEHG